MKLPMWAKETEIEIQRARHEKKKVTMKPDKAETQECACLLQIKRNNGKHAKH